MNCAGQPCNACRRALSRFFSSGSPEETILEFFVLEY
nr:MAG TPA: Blasticidin-S deaminase [Caudoviricetes sp.]